MYYGKAKKKTRTFGEKSELIFFSFIWQKIFYCLWGVYFLLAERLFIAFAITLTFFHIIDSPTSDYFILFNFLLKFIKALSTNGYLFQN